MKQTNFELHRLTLQNSKGIPSIKQYLRKVREDSGPNQIIIEVEQANAGGYQPHTIFWRIWVSSLRLKFPSLRKLMEEASNTQISNFEDYFANFAKNAKHLIYEHRYNVLSVLPVHIYDHFEVKYHLKEVPIEPFSILPKISSTEYQETVPVEPFLKGKSNETKDYPGKAATAAIDSASLNRRFEKFRSMRLTMSMTQKKKAELLLVKTIFCFLYEYLQPSFAWDYLYSFMKEKFYLVRDVITSLAQNLDEKEIMNVVNTLQYIQPRKFTCLRGNEDILPFIEKMRATVPADVLATLEEAFGSASQTNNLDKQSLSRIMEYYEREHAPLLNAGSQLMQDLKTLLRKEEERNLVRKYCDYCQKARNQWVQYFAKDETLDFDLQENLIDQLEQVLQNYRTKIFHDGASSTSLIDSQKLFSVKTEIESILHTHVSSSSVTRLTAYALLILIQEVYCYKLLSCHLLQENLFQLSEGKEQIIVPKNDYDFWIELIELFLHVISPAGLDVFRDYLSYWVEFSAFQIESSDPFAKEEVHLKEAKDALTQQLQYYIKDRTERKGTDSPFRSKKEDKRTLTKTETKQAPIHQKSRSDEDLQEMISDTAAVSSTEKFQNKYTLGEKVGKGGFANVHLGRNTQGETFAIKVIDKRNLADRDIDSCRKEAELLRRLSPHPHIIQLYEFYEETDSIYLVLEYLKGGELFGELLKRNNYTEYDARNIIKTVLETLRHIHSFNIVHRDLKLENLLLSDHSSDATIKIADFGTADVITDEQGLSGFVGTIQYMAPETIQGDFSHTSVDVWAVGVLTFVLLSGKLPFRSQDENVLKNKISKGLLELKDDFWYAVTPFGKRFVRELLVKDPKERLTVDAALSHPWFQIEDKVLQRKPLPFATVAKVAHCLKRWRLKTQQRKLNELEYLSASNEKQLAALPEGEANLENQQSDSFSDPARSDDIVVHNKDEKIEKSELETIHEHDEEEEEEEKKEKESCEDEDTPLEPLFSIQSLNSEQSSFSIVKKLENHYYSILYAGINNLTQDEVLVEVYDLPHLPKPLHKLIQNEINIVKSLPYQHKNILHFYSITYEPEKCYVVQEKLFGKELLDRIAENTSYAENEVKSIFHALLEAVAFLHENNVVHRAIAPENILFSSDSIDAEIKLLNFRAAKRLEPTPDHGRRISHSTSYTAPELINPNQILNAIEKAGDLWSLGVLLYLLLVGKDPFPQYDETTLETALANRSNLFSNEIGWDVISPAAKDLVNKLLERNPLTRLTAAQALKHDWFQTSLSENERKVEEITIKTSDSDPDPSERQANQGLLELNRSLSNLKRLHAKKKFQKAIRAVIFVSRVHKCVERKNQLKAERGLPIKEEAKKSSTFSLVTFFWNIYEKLNSHRELITKTNLVIR